MNNKHEILLRRCLEISKESVEGGNHPFGALIADKDGNILIESTNIEVTEKDCTGHAETTAMKLAGKKYSKDFLWSCTLYTTAEPCCMCAGAAYWGNIGHIAYEISEKQLLQLTGAHEDNPTFDNPCRNILANGQKKIKVDGPIASQRLAEEIADVHRKYWK